MIENDKQCPDPHLVETFGEIDKEENIAMTNANEPTDCQHNWVTNSGDGGDPDFRRGLGPEPTMHVLCSKCNARTWLTEAQWEALSPVSEDIEYLEIPDFLRRQDLVAKQIAQLQREHLALTRRNGELEAGLVERDEKINALESGIAEIAPWLSASLEDHEHDGGGNYLAACNSIFKLDKPPPEEKG